MTLFGRRAIESTRLFHKKLLRVLPLLAVVLFFVLSASVAYADSYMITDLGTLGGTNSKATAINNRAQVVGYSWTSTNGFPHAFLYDSGKMRDLGVFPKGDVSFALDINDAEQVVGYSSAGPNPDGAFLYSDGVLRGISGIRAYGINNGGVVVGVGGNSDLRAFIREDGRTEYLHFPYGYSPTFAYAVNDEGQVVGTGRYFGELQAFIYEDGVASIVPVGDGKRSEAFDINNNGEVVGSVISGRGPDTTYTAFVYRDGKVIELGNSGQKFSQAFAINNRGQVVGTFGPGLGAKTADSGSIENRAFLFTRGGLVDLNDLLPEDSGWALLEATGINDHGQIVGTGLIGEQQHAFLLTPLVAPQPVPEPATLLLLGTGLAGIGGVVRRKRQNLKQ